MDMYYRLGAIASHKKKPCVVRRGAFFIVRLLERDSPIYLKMAVTFLA